MEGLFQHLTSLCQSRLTPEMYDFINVLVINQTKLAEKIGEKFGTTLTKIEGIDDFEEISNSLSVKIFCCFAVAAEHLIGVIIQDLEFIYLIKSRTLTLGKKAVHKFQTAIFFKISKIPSQSLTNGNFAVL